ncbi:MAG: ATP-binding protein [Bacteroidetes bacterium]|nr:MAG: ATP-binding protein [Bacteroidota bacterium]
MNNNNETTLEHMRRMKLYGMQKAFKLALDNQSLSILTADELIAHLVAQEWDDRQNRSVERTVKNAKFRYPAQIENILFETERGIDKNFIYRLAECDFIRKAENLIITGSTGTGKSYMASAIGHQACLKGLKVYYTSTSRLLSQLKMAKADGSALKELIRLERVDALILDDFGIQPFDHQSRMLLMDIIEDRHGKKSTIFTSQLPVSLWYEIIGDNTIADAILDRVVHDAHRIELQGESLRKKVKLKSE